MVQFHSTKGQVWNIDFMMGTLIFISVLVFFFVSLQGLETPADNDLQDLLDQARTMSDELLTPGYPLDWTIGNVVRVGIASGQRIDESKLGITSFGRNLNKIGFKITKSKKTKRVSD